MTVDTFQGDDVAAFCVTHLIAAADPSSNVVAVRPHFRRGVFRRGVHPAPHFFRGRALGYFFRRAKPYKKGPNVWVVVHLGSDVNVPWVTRPAKVQDVQNRDPAATGSSLNLKSVG